jgi:hypothetical protein
MERAEELKMLARKLSELRKQSNHLFASQVEMRINLQLLAEKQSELFRKSQYLAALTQTILRGKNILLPPTG